MPAPTPEEEIESLNEQIRDLRAQLTAAQESPSELAELRRQLADARAELDRVRAVPATPPARRTDGFFEVDDEGNTL